MNNVEQCVVMRFVFRVVVVCVNWANKKCVAFLHGGPFKLYSVVVRISKQDEAAFAEHDTEQNEKQFACMKGYARVCVCNRGWTKRRMSGNVSVVKIGVGFR